MYIMGNMNLFEQTDRQAPLSARKLNIIRSPKKHGSSDRDSLPFLKELGINLGLRTIPIQFTPNINESVHRWAPYVQGFSAQFVQSVLDQYREIYPNPIILDPFAGCGTVLVQAKLNGFESVGTELNPLLQFIANAKLSSWDVSPKHLLRVYARLPRNRRAEAPSFLKCQSHFNPGVLANLEKLKGSINSYEAENEKQRKVKDLLNLAFSAILVDCSNLKRTPCLGYWKAKRVDDRAPFILMNKKIQDIANDLGDIKTLFGQYIKTPSYVNHADAMEYVHKRRFDLVITSPPYMNGLDYVMNYKIEMGWLGFGSSHKELKSIKDRMVVCDNVSKGLIRQFDHDSTRYSNGWIEQIKTEITANIKRRGRYRRTDMPEIVHKYFNDMHRVMKNVISALKNGGRFVQVVGDSLIADVYVPTDLILAKIGVELGCRIEKIEKARDRRSGQIRTYKLRESIITLVK